MQNVIAIDDVEEPVRRFLEKLTPSPEGSMVEMNGRRVYLMVRSTAEPSETEEPWTDKKNHRRAALIDKELAGTITPVEAIELEELTQQLRQHREKIAPFPIDYARQLLEELTARAKPNGDSE